MFLVLSGLAQRFWFDTARYIDFSIHFQYIEDIRGTAPALFDSSVCVLHGMICGRWGRSTRVTKSSERNRKHFVSDRQNQILSAVTGRCIWKIMMDVRKTSKRCGFHDARPGAASPSVVLMCYRVLRGRTRCATPVQIIRSQRLGMQY